MVRKLRVSLLLQPLATALFANSPFTEGRPNGFLSVPRACLDRHRQPALRHSAVMFEPGFGFERYAEWLVDRRADVFRLSQWRIYRRRRRLVPRLHGRPAAQPRRAPSPPSATSPITSPRCSPTCGSSASWRCAAPMPGSADMMVAQSAFWVGLLYDEAALSAAEALLRGRDLGGCGGAARRGAARGAGRDLARRQPARPGARRRRHRPRRAARPGAPQRCRAWTNRSISLRWRQLPPANQPRQNIGWRATIRRGRVTSGRIFAEAAI